VGGADVSFHIGNIFTFLYMSIFNLGNSLNRLTPPVNTMFSIMGSNATKGIAITLAGLVLTVGLSTTSLISAKAKDDSPKNYEAMLSVELQPNTTTKDLAKSIKQDLGNLSDVDIISLSSKLDFEGKTQTFTKSNEEQVNSQKLLDSYSKSQNAFLTTIVNMKEQTDSGQTIENQEAIKPLLNKYSKNTLKNTQEKYKAKTPIVSSVVLGGSLANLNKLNSGSLKAISIKVELINLVEAQKQADEVKIKLDKATTQVAKDKVLKDEIAKILPQGDNQQSSLNFDQNKVQEIDKLTRKDLNGNIFINSDEVKIKLGLTDTQVTEVSKAMNNFNKLPLELKDNSVGSTQAVAQTTQLKIEENNQKDIGEKVSQLFLGSVKVSAQWNGYCDAQSYRTNYYWWGYTDRMNQCASNAFAYNYGNQTTALAYLGSAVCIAIAPFYFWPGIICGGVVAFIALIRTLAKDRVAYLAQYCGWISIDMTYWNTVSSYCS
jgi:hypothetical protein